MVKDIGDLSMGIGEYVIRDFRSKIPKQCGLNFGESYDKCGSNFRYAGVHYYMKFESNGEEVIFDFVASHHKFDEGIVSVIRGELPKETDIIRGEDFVHIIYPINDVSNSDSLYESLFKDIIKPVMKNINTKW